MMEPGVAALARASHSRLGRGRTPRVARRPPPARRAGGSPSPSRSGRTGPARRPTGARRAPAPRNGARAPRPCRADRHLGGGRAGAHVGLELPGAQGRRRLGDRPRRGQDAPRSRRTAAEGVIDDDAVTLAVLVGHDNRVTRWHPAARVRPRAGPPSSRVSTICSTVPHSLPSAGAQPWEAQRCATCEPRVNTLVKSPGSGAPANQSWLLRRAIWLDGPPGGAIVRVPSGTGTPNHRHDAGARARLSSRLVKVTREPSTERVTRPWRPTTTPAQE